ncbi:MAG: efflux RND transporter periplasmic adaptor subunit [Gammaproteobacteria bacterium]|nr:efflux RND transporter periplasmic adaptor subunit [Gammaproteobacteria bacterium]MCP5423580.1 efflux RND transporter periplasmic adaptor subunit [Gammaproteobacteria bacterium]
MKRFIAGTLCATALLAGGAAYAQSGPPAMPVKTAAVKQGEVVSEITALGTLRSEEAVLIRPEIAGRIETIHFQEGQIVPKGAPLVTLDQSEHRARLAGSTAELELSRISYQRLQDLYNQRLTSHQNLDEAKAKLDAARAQQTLDEALLDKTVIRAPFAGVVGLRQVSPGAYVEEGQDIAGFGSIGSMKLDFRVPEVYLSKLAVDQSVAIQLDAYPDETFTGAVYAIDPAIDPETRTVLLRARLPNPEKRLRPGMFARLTLTVAQRPNALLVPEQAIVPMGDKSFVFRVVEGKAALTPVTVGERQPGQVEISAGLNQGDQVITDGQIKIFDGAPVTVMEQPAQSPAAGG